MVKGLRDVMNGTLPEFEMEYACHSTTQQRWFLCRVTRFAAAGPLRVVVSHENITLRRQAEESLILGERRFRAVIEASPVPFAVNDDLHKISLLNPAFVRLFGYEQSEIPTLEDWWPKGYPDPQYRAQVAADWNARMDRSLKTGLPFEEMEVTICCKDGTSRDVRVGASFIGDDREGAHLVAFHDITDIRQSERALRESEFRWKFAVEGSGDGMWDWDVSAGTVLLSPQWKAMLGYAVEEIGSGLEEWSKRVHPEELPAVMAALNDHLEGRKPEYASEHRVLCKDGTWKWILDRGIVVTRNEAGKPLRMIGTHHDVTERRQAEEALKASETRYRRLFETAKDGILILDVGTGMVVDVNPFLIELLGYNREAILSKKVWELGFIKDVIANEANFAELRDKEYIRYEDLALEASDGHRVEVEFISNVYQVNSHKVIQCNIRDITVRKRAEAAFATFFEQPLGLNLVCSLEGRIERANQAWELVLGYQPEKLVGTNILDYILPEDRAITITELDSLAQGATTFHFQNRYRHKQGGFRLLSWSAIASSDKVYGMAIDITEMEEAKRHLRLQEAMLKNVSEGMSLTRAADAVILLANPQFENLFGYDPGELAGRHVTTLNASGEKTSANVAEEIITSLEVHGKWSGELENVRKDGTRFWSHADVVVFHDSLHGKVWVTSQHDITERRKAEQELRFQAALDKGLLDLPSAAERLDESAFLQHGQEFAEDLTGSLISFVHFVLPDQETIELVTWSRRTLEHYCHAAYDSHYPVKSAGIWADALRERKPVVFNDYPSYAHKHGLPEGHSPLQRLISVPVLESGKVVMITGVGNKGSNYTERDIQAVQLISESLWRIVQRRRSQAQMQKFSLAIEQNPASIVITDLEGRIEYVNSRLTELTGYTFKECQGQTPRIFKSDQTPATVHQELWRTIRQGGTWRGELVNRKKNGELHTELVVVTPVRDSEDRMSHFVAVKEDVTWRKQSEAQLQIQGAALAAAANVIVITDKNGTIEWVNDSFCRATGYTREEAIGQNPRVLKSGHHPREFYESMWKTILSGEVWHGEIHNLRKDGTPFEEDVTITPVRGAGGSIEHYVAIKQDITERKALERRYLRAQRMESVGMLAGGIAHDLNNVLSPISMGLEVLRESNIPDDCRRMLDSMLNSVQRGASIVKQVLTFARGTDGEKSCVQLRHLIRDIRQMCEETFPRNIRMQSDVVADLWMVMADPTQIHQVLLNLSVNARDAMPDGGLLTFSAQNVNLTQMLAQEIQEAKPGRYVLLKVGDTGLGMPPEVQNHLFEPFFTTKPQGQGTGLGLATVLGIVRSHGGFIDLHSEVGKGTEFKIYLPADPAGVAAEKPAADALPLGHGEIILLVDDEPGILSVAKIMLEKCGYKTLAAKDGAEAVGLYALRKNEIALVLTDIMMPMMDGVALVHALRKINPQVRVITMSGLSNQPGQPDRIAGLQSQGVRRHLSKPFTQQALLNSVHQELHEP